MIKNDDTILIQHGNHKSVEEAIAEIQTLFPDYVLFVEKDRKGYPFPTYNCWISPDETWIVYISVEFPTKEIEDWVSKQKKYDEKFTSNYESYFFCVNREKIF